MRQIKFRGKRVDNEEWAYGSIVISEIPVGDDFHTEIHVPFANLGSAIVHKVDPATIGQFTGLYDKDGKEIWEGDVVDHNNRYFVVEFNIKFGFVSREIKRMSNWRNMEFFYNSNKYIKVIGNIHDNPELIGGNHE